MSVHRGTGRATELQLTFNERPEAARSTLRLTEPDGRQAPQPDDPHFGLPQRMEGEAVSGYLGHLPRATAHGRIVAIAKLHVRVIARIVTRAEA